MLLRSHGVYTWQYVVNYTEPRQTLRNICTDSPEVQSYCHVAMGTHDS
uniref:Uncharacterized protein n=1 Tax=Zea mays TaxID=4577 RepID=C0PAN4_MAIZE|nr:unknown [Zea mays]